MNNKLQNQAAKPLRPAVRYSAVFLTVLSMGLAGSANAGNLPDPGDDINGIPASVQYDDAWSYSTRVLNYLDPTGGWDATAGTGTLDVIITTRSSGQTNSDIAGDIYAIPDPITNEQEKVAISDSWGGGATADTQMRVMDLYDYLWDTFGANTPVFTFDQNETGGNPDLLVNAKVEIIDPNGALNGGALVLQTWSFDGTTQALDGVYDAASFVTAPGEICIPDVMNSVKDDTVCFSNNVGSGKFDYIIYVPTMNLTLWDDSNTDADNLFKVSWEFRNVDDGGEEITLTGRFTGTTCENDPTLPQCQTIPEPGSLALFGGALLALIGLRRSRKTVL